MNLPLEALLEGKYEILDKIAEGGIGSIYKVRHKLLEEIRVIKVLRSQVADRKDLHDRLLQEAKTAIKLEHPSIARLFDLTVAEDGTAYIVMEFIDGVSLDSLLAATGPPSVELAVEVARQSLGALDYLHERGFIHRDISPDNLMLTRDFSHRLRVKLIDLGIAKDLAQETGVTAVGTFLGKVKYCAPELFKEAGVKELDQRSDNYSLAITLYELLTGQHPFKGETFEELAAGHLFHPPADFELTDPEGRVPQALRDIILGALAKDPDDRPANARAFADSLDQFAIDEQRLADEFATSVGATTRFLTKFQSYSSGSTQDHLNRQFGMKTTGLKAAAETMATPPGVAAAPAGGRSRSKLWLSALAALPLAAIALWMVWRPQAARPVVETAQSIPLVAAERFDPDAAGDVIAASELPSEFQEESAAPASPPQGPAARPAKPAVESADPAVRTSSETRVQPDAETTETELDPREVKLLKAGPGVVAPKLLDVLEPPYPKPDKNEIVVVLSAFVSHTGEVLTATITEGPSFKRRYREAAVAAVQRARFEPATENGVPGKMWVEVEVRFKP